MTGKGITETVNRAFLVIGSLFIFGGLYLGVLTFLDAPEVYEIEGKILSVRVEKRRPMGFEDIPEDSTDPAHKDLILYTDSYAEVEFTWNGVTSTAEIVSWQEEPGWAEGVTLPLYLVEGEEEYPLNYFPSEAAGEKKEALIIILAMPLMGAVLVLVSLFTGRGERARDLVLLEKVNELAKPWYPGMTYNRTLYEAVNKGSYFLGGIMTGIGSVLTAVIAVLLAKSIPSGSFEDWKILPFPLLLGIGILYIGLSEFVRVDIRVTDRRVYLKRWSLFGKREEERKIGSFGGIKEQILQKEVPGSLKRHIYREQILLHQDPLFNGISIALIPDDGRADAAAKELSASLNLPRILEDGDSIILDYPVKESVREGTVGSSDEPYELPGDFSSKYLTLAVDEPDHLLVTRSFRKSLIWGSFIFTAGAAAAVLTGAYTILIPVFVISLIFDGIGLRRDELEIKDGVLRAERFIAGRTYYRETIPVPEIEEVLSGNDPRMTVSLEILGGGKRIYFGQAASKRELDWLKARIRSLLL
ncbi:MAG: hypothetical protein PQJ50_05550 [Spirochaetales bacterium]|nr:hypothetical protein [Spirochaetales bacterium]